MMNFDTPTSTLPQNLAGALRRLAQLAHTSSWDQWAVQRLTPMERVAEMEAIALRAEWQPEAIFMRLRWKCSFNGSASTQKKNIAATNGLIGPVAIP